MLIFDIVIIDSEKFIELRALKGCETKNGLISSR
jgi:hypothetical protein